MGERIPKVIHYCWFGGNPLTELAEKCIASWKKYCPDYEIVEWNESNFDIDCCEYVREAYDAKKWAFVSDYARYKILYEHGGVYLDTDVEVLRPLDDLVINGGFMGCENYTTDKMCVNPGVGCATVPGHSFYAEILADYEKSHFRNQDGTLNLYTVVERTTDLLDKYGLKASLGVQQVGNITIYPAEVLSPASTLDGKLRVTENTYSIHHGVASWSNKSAHYYSAFLKFVYRCFGEKGFARLRKIFGKRKS